MNAKQMIGALAVLAVLVAIYFAVSGGRQTTKTVATDQFAVEQEKIGQVVLENSNGTLHFKQQGEDWRLDGYPVDKGRFDPLLEALAGIETDRLVSNQAANFAKYGVDSSATKVRLLDEGGAELLAFLLGKQGASYTETMVRKIDGAKVYSVKASLSRYSSAAKGEYWAKEIADFDAAFVSKVTVTGAAAYTLENTPQGWTYDGQPADSAKVMRTVNDLARLRGNKVFAEVEGKDFAQEIPVLSASVELSDQRVVELRFFAHSSEHQRYATKQRKGQDLRTVPKAKPTALNWSTPKWRRRRSPQVEEAPPLTNRISTPKRRIIKYP